MAKLEIQRRFKTKVIEVGPRTILAIKQPSNVTDAEMDTFLQQFADEIMRRLDYSSIIIGVKRLDEIQALDEERMNHYGWYRNDSMDEMRDIVDGIVEEEE